MNFEWNYVKGDGTFLSDKFFRFCFPFKDGFGTVETTKGWNFIDKNGKLLSSEDFIASTDFIEGFAKVKTEKGWIYIDTENNVIPCKYIESIRNSNKPEESPFKCITNKMYSIYTEKNKNYGNSFDKSLDDDGLLVSKIRLGDKFNRFSSLIKQNSKGTSDESIEDTLLDMANYAIMTLMWLQKSKNNGNN